MSKDIEREGFYEKMWKDFVSFQRGDAGLICKDAARFRWLKENHLQTGPDSWIRTGDDLEEAIDEGMKTPNVIELSGTPQGRKPGAQRAVSALMRC